MKQGNKFATDMLDFDDPAGEEDRLWRAARPTAVEAQQGVVRLAVPFYAQHGRSFIPEGGGAERCQHTLEVRAYGPEVLRLSIAFDGQPPAADSVMLQWDPELLAEPLTVREAPGGLEAVDSGGCTRLRLHDADPPIRHWSDLVPPPPEALSATLLPDGRLDLPLWAHDAFYPAHLESMGLGFLTRKDRAACSLLSVHARPSECFAGTGERFSKMDLAGRTLTLENADALGVNSRRAYKNTPFYVSSRGYGLLYHTSAHVRLSLADVSTRAAQARVDEGRLDVFVFGGGSLERVLRNYRRVTGFPADVPLWSYGIWMSRMTYYSAAETLEVARQLRQRELPCDILHLDTGWFPRDWKCEWEFSEEKFPDAAGYMAGLRRQGFRVTLWNHPRVEPDNKHYEEACESRYLAPRIREAAEGRLEYGEFIDFSYPEAVRWYQGLLRALLEQGAVCFKTDFGEEIDMGADYLGMPAALLHNLYVLLYQKAAFEVTREVTGQPLIWARGGWTGCQRYPVHWGGDAACTWDGLASTLRGGLHLGLSGFGFWSHDVPGFHGQPDFMNHWPDPALYIRWTQLGVLCSHIRYHGTSPREPYRYPDAEDVVRRWWRLRYALIPYLAEQGRWVTTSGYPLLRALVLHHQEDPVCWHIDDQFFCGEALLAAPVMSPDSVRDVYLPRGSWTDLWTGEVRQGPLWLPQVPSPLGRIPLYAATGATIKVYPERVQCTDEMDLSRAVNLTFDQGYQGIKRSVLGDVTGLE